MKKASIKVPDVFTRADDVCYGMIEVYPQDADGIDLTSSKAEKFEKLVPAVRAVCYNAPDMYYTLREIVNMANSGSTTKEISVYANEMVEKVENIFSIDKKASRALQLNNKTNEAEVEIREYEKELFISYCKIWHTGDECTKSECEVKNALENNESFDNIFNAFMEVDGDWESWETFRDDNFILLLDTIEDATRATSVKVDKMSAYFIDIDGLSKTIKIFRPVPYSILGGKKIRGKNEN